MALSEKDVKEFQDIYKKEFGKEISFDEAAVSGQRLVDLMKLLMDMDLVERKRKAKLTDSPNGFHLDEGTYSCRVCQRYVTGHEGWYDKHGVKCLLCQKALEKRVIPVSVLKDRDSWYSIYDFQSYFGIKHQSIRKLVRDGVLKSRIIIGPHEKPYFELLLIKDNPGFLNQKPRSYTVQNKDGSFSIGYEEVKLSEVLQRLRTK